MVSRIDARFITKDEMVGFLEKADREGLVLKPQNTQSPIVICRCCRC